MNKLFTKGYKLNIIVALLCLATTLTFAAMMAYAATSTQDGLTAVVTTDKTSYISGESVTATVTVSNDNSYAMNNVRLEIALPAGLTLKSGQTSIVVETLEAGAKQEYTLTARVDKTQKAIIPLSNPRTGDNFPIGLCLVLMLLSIAGLTAIALLGRKGRRAVKTFSIFLCFTLVLSIVVPSIPVFSAIEHRTLTVAQSVKVDGESKNITLTVNYDHQQDAVNQTPLAIKEGNLIKTYGDAPFTLEAIGGSTGNAVTWTSSDPTVASVVQKDATHATVTIHKTSTAAITITAVMLGSLGSTGDTPKYLDTYAQITLTVNKKTLIVTADDKMRGGRQENPVFTIQYDGFVSGEDETALATAPTASCEAGTSATAGTYAITVSGGVSENYDFKYVSGTLTVTGKEQPELSIAEGGAINKTYGDTAFSLSTKGGAGTGMVSWSSNNACVSVDNNGNATINGAGTAIITATKAADSDYAKATAQTTIVVAKKELTVTAESKSKNYGEANPALTITYSGFVNGDTVDSLTTKPTATTEATASSGVGTYAITVSGGASDNYTFNYVSSNLRINQSGQPTLSITQGENIGVTYGDLAFALGLTGGAGTGAVTWSSNNACVTVNATSGQVTINSSGTATITAIKAADDNYTEATAQTTVTVAKKELTVTADDKSKIYGEVNPALTLTYIGFVNGEDENALTTKPTASTEASQLSSVGTYSITVSGGAADNYTFNYVSAILTVSEAAQPPLSVTQGMNIAKSYGDLPFTLSTTGGAGTGAVTWSSSDPEVASINANTGEVTIHKANEETPVTITAIKAADGDYTKTTAQTTVAVAKKELTVTADDKTKLAGEANPTLTLTYSGFVNGDTVDSLATKPTASTTVTPSTLAGTYAITASGGESNNYSFKYVNGTLTVTASFSVNYDVTTNGGTGVIASQYYSYGATANAADTTSVTPPEKHSFYKWNTTADASGTWYTVGDSLPIPAAPGGDSSITLYAVYSLNASDAPFKVDSNGVISGGDIKGDLVIPPVVNGIVVKQIADKAFFENKNLKSVTLPNTLESIGEAAFRDCDLVEVIIPGSVTLIVGDAFSHNKSLTTVTFLGDKPKMSHDKVFYFCLNVEHIYYLSGKTGWNGFESFLIYGELETLFHIKAEEKP